MKDSNNIDRIITKYIITNELRIIMSLVIFNSKEKLFILYFQN